MTPSLGRIALAALVGGIVWFAWGAFAHMACNLGESSMRKLPNEAAVMSSLRDGKSEDGLYLFPYWDERGDPSMEKYAEQCREGPVGMLIYRQSVQEIMPPSMLVKEFLGGLVASAIVAFILSRLPWGVLASARVAGLCAVAAWCSHSFSEWIWYGYPWMWVMDSLLEQIVGWMLAGASITFTLRGRTGL